jgi:hypothetical protein
MGDMSPGIVITERMVRTEDTIDIADISVEQGQVFDALVFDHDRVEGLVVLPPSNRADKSLVIKVDC